MRALVSAFGHWLDSKQGKNSRASSPNIAPCGRNPTLPNPSRAGADATSQSDRFTQEASTVPNGTERI
jgi:hypothetical protein